MHSVDVHVGVSEMLFEARCAALVSVNSLQNWLCRVMGTAVLGDTTNRMVNGRLQWIQSGMEVLHRVDRSLQVLEVVSILWSLLRCALIFTFLACRIWVLATYQSEQCKINISLRNPVYGYFLTCNLSALHYSSWGSPFYGSLHYYSAAFQMLVAIFKAWGILFCRLFSPLCCLLDFLWKWISIFSSLFPISWNYPPQSFAPFLYPCWKLY